MATPQQIQHFLNHCESVLDFTIEAPNGYRSAPLCALDSVFSIGIRYSIVVNVLNRFCDRLGLDYTSSTITTSEVLSRIEDISVEDLAEQYMSRNRTSSRNGILKADAYKRFLQVMRKYGVETCEDIHRVSENAAFKNEIKEIPGQRSGLSLDYLFILSGMTDYVKVDRHIQRFVWQVIPNEINIVELIRTVARIMSESTHPGMNARHLDHIIWNYGANGSR